VLAGDGIGPEITAATLQVVRAAAKRFSLALELDEEIVGHASLSRYGTTVRPELLDKVRAADGLILGPAATYDSRTRAKARSIRRPSSARTSTSSPTSAPRAPIPDCPRSSANSIS
jgi:isocitrate/isopropylmalate dehydrogenase